MPEESIQDSYPDEYSHCYGCGRLNDHGLRIHSRREGDECVAVFEPSPQHIGIPGFVYGGLIASLVDCHGVATAYAAAAEEQEHGNGATAQRFVTAALHVDFLRPTPMGVPLTIRAAVKEIRGRKIVVGLKVIAGGIECARGEVVAVRIPETMSPNANPST
jgi:acyl-coenzyme A thioesterase PaaI-like protein